MQKLYSHGVLSTITPARTWLLHEGACLGCSFKEITPRGNMVAPWRSTFTCSPSTCSLKEQPCSLEEQLCLKLCVNITFACEFWLKCFQVQSYSSLRNPSNDRLQAYIKNYYEMIMIAKKFKTYVFSRNNHVPKERKLKLTRETT